MPEEPPRQEPLPAPAPLFIEKPRGSYCRTQHTARDAMMYGIYDHELTTLGLLNGISAGALAAGTSLVSLGIGLAIDVAVSPQSVTAPVNLTVIYWLIGVLSVGCFVASGLAWYARGSTVSEIRRKSRPTHQSHD